MKKLIVPIVVSIFAFGMTACEKQGPMEKAGEKLDEAGRDIKEGVEEAGEKIENKADEISVSGSESKTSQ